MHSGVHGAVSVRGAAYAQMAHTLLKRRSSERLYMGRVYAAHTPRERRLLHTPPRPRDRDAIRYAKAVLFLQLKDFCFRKPCCFLNK